MFLGGEMIILWAVESMVVDILIFSYLLRAHVRICRPISMVFAETVTQATVSSRPWWRQHYTFRKLGRAVNLLHRFDSDNEQFYPVHEHTFFPLPELAICPARQRASKT
jgi:hypothetical protein